MAKTGIPGLTFSWKRALGVTNAKRKVAKATGIPTTKSGRRNRAGRSSESSNVKLRQYGAERLNRAPICSIIDSDKEGLMS